MESLDLTAHKEALEFVKIHQSRGFHVNNSIIEYLQSGSPVEKMFIENPDEFLNLQFHAIDESRLLTPHGEPRTLRRVVERMREMKWPFEILKETIPDMSHSLHHPEWFRTCSNIEQNGFSYENFGAVFLKALTDDEIRESPTATFSLQDGNHRSLVLASMLMQGKVNFSPIPAFLFKPHPKKP